MEDYQTPPDIQELNEPSPQDEHRSELMRLLHKHSDHIKSLFNLDPGMSKPAPKVDMSAMNNPLYDTLGQRPDALQHYDQLSPGDKAALVSTGLSAALPNQTVPPAGPHGVMSALQSNESELVPSGGQHGIFSAINSRADDLAPPDASEAWHAPMALPGGNPPPVQEARGSAKAGGLAPFHPTETNMDAGSNDLGSVQHLVNAQNAAGQGRLVNQLGRSAELIGSGIAHNNPVGQKIYDEQAKEADRGINEFKAQVEQQKDDPNSSISGLFRQYAKKLGVNIAGDFTAGEGEKLLPFMFKDFEAQQQNAFKDQELKYKTQELGEQRRFHDLMLGQQKNTATEAKATKDETKNYNSANMAWNKLEQSGRGTVGLDSKKVAGADGLDAFASKFKDLNDVTPQMAAEFTSAFNNLTTGGQASDVKFKKVMPPGVGMKAADVLQWIKNQPVGGRQGAFIQMMLDSAHAQKEMSQSRLKEAAIKFMESQSHVNPVDAQKFYHARGIAPEEIESVLGGKRLYGRAPIAQADLGASGGELSSKSQAMVDHFLEKNPGTSPEEAAKVLKSKGYIQ